MRSIVPALLLVVSGVCIAQPQQQPVPRGIRAGDRAVDDAVHSESPTVSRGRAVVDPIVLKAEAAQLQGLADSLPAQVDQVTKGMLPKDVSENLKKIEKLAKHLRSEINP